MNYPSLRFLPFLQTAAKWLLLGVLVGGLAGTASAVFLISLNWATAARLANPWLIYFLPVAGLAVGWAYWRVGGRASQGNNLVIDEVNRDQERLPLRMAPLVLVGTIATHLFGGSAGREGTAVQMGASMADSLRRVLPIPPADRRLLIMAGIAGGFGSVFGVPAAGFIFGMEVQTVGRVRYEGLIPCLTAAYVGDWVTRSLGAPHSHYPHMPDMGMNGLLALKVALAGLICGLVSMAFVELVHAIKALLRWQNVWPPLQPVVGGVAVLGLAALFGSDYLGLSLPLIQDSVGGAGVVPWAWALKLLFTAVTLGCGYQGGEVTPLLVIGATLGYALGGWLGVDPAFMAAIGLVAVFAGASNTPLASAVMGIELVGGGAALYMILGCALAYFSSGHRGIYATQPIDSPKAFGADVQVGERLRDVAERRRGAAE